MQILIDLHVLGKEGDRMSKKEERGYKKELLNTLMFKLESVGNLKRILSHKITKDIKKRTGIQYESKTSLIDKKDLVKSIISTDACTATIDTSENLMLVENKYFIAMCLCNNRKVRPLSIGCFIDNFEELVIKENKSLLDQLYYESFVDCFGEDFPAIPTFIRPL